MRLEGVVALAGMFRLGPVGFFLPAGGRLWLAGPTGSGKSLLLQVVAGVVAPARGSITLDGMDLLALPPEARQVGWLPQEALLFPHLDGRQNIQFGGFRGRPPDASAWRDLISMLEIEPLLARRPDALSGGERQRLALARALWRRPRILLLDEPLAALGAAWRPRFEALLATDRGGTMVVETTHGIPPGVTGQIVRLQAGQVL